MSFISDMFAKKAPAAPSGSELTAAQTQANQVNQYTPNFNQVYGTVDAGGNFQARPGASAVQVTESPEAKALRERIQGVTQNFANTMQAPANMDLSRLPSLTNESQIRSNVGSGQDIRDAQFKQATDLLNPQFDREQERLDQRLADQGIYRGGSSEDAYSRAQGDFARNKNSSLENAALSAILAGGAEQNRQYGNELSLAGYTSGQRAQGFGEQGTMRNQGFNELASINGLQPLPQFVNTPSIDAAGNMLASNAIQSNNVNSRNAMTSQLLGAGAGVAGAYFGGRYV